ncbi:MAG: DMT family transporter, partial [Bacillota bacterium]|nr:DMT family transporter [Bacillota bacterium]
MDTRKIFTNKKLIIILSTFCCLLWGSAFPAVKIGYAWFNISADDVPSKLVFAGLRFTFSGILVLLTAVAAKRNIFSLNRKNIRQLILLGVTQTTLQYIFFYVGLGYTTGVKGSIIDGTGTFFSVILAHFIYSNDRLNFNKVLGCILGFAGVLAINFSTDLL